MKSKFIMEIVICTIMSSVLIGCGSNHGTVAESNTANAVENTETVQLEVNMVVLNERQKQILKDNGLSEAYDQLTDSQKDAIVKIERVLCYLEEKYNHQFEYDGYVASGIDGQYVTVKIPDTQPEKIVTVDISYEDGKYIYSDNYKELMAEDEFSKEVETFLSDYLHSGDFKVYVEILELKEKGDSVVERATACPVIFLNNVYSESEVEAAAKAFAEWIVAMKNKNGGGADFRILEKEDYAEVNEFNYKDYFGKDILWLSVSVNSNKSIEVQRY